MSYILIVEDTMDHAALFSVILQQAAYETKLITDGQAAWDYLQTTDELPSLVLSDVSMPRMDGFELCYLIKNEPKLSHIPFILSTAIYPELTPKVAPNVQADAYLTKPIDFQELLDLVKKYVP